MDEYNFTSVEMIPEINAKAVFINDSSSVFRDDVDIRPITIDDKTKYMPWGADNMMPFNILDLIERDETLATCQIFNAEVCYASGLTYNTDNCSPRIKKDIEDFCLSSPLPAYFLGVCQDFKHFGWCVSVIILDNEGKRIVQVRRKEACYCRFSPANDKGNIEYLLYANWRRHVGSAKDIEKIELLDMDNPWGDLEQRIKAKTKTRKFAVVCRVPTPDSTYYPIPHYAAIFRGKWYNIKQLIGIAKESKLKNTAPLKYQIEVSQKYWEGIFKRERITDTKKMQERVVKEKQQIIDFLTGAENSGKVLFSTFYISPTGEEQHDVKITKIDQGTEGGDWSTDIQEAVNMICFTMRVHSNLVGSVPGKSQSNNSGSDKRELYTIAQSLQKPYRDLLFILHRMIIRFNGWKGAYPECQLIQLTTLDENTDAKTVTLDNKNEK